jgi:hypothetical protein
MARTVCCAVGPGSTTPGTAGPRTATGTVPATATTTLASAFPELKGLDDPIDQTIIRSVQVLPYGETAYLPVCLMAEDSAGGLAGRFF